MNCETCGTKLDEKASFCAGCGTPVSGEATAAAKEAAPPEPVAPVAPMEPGTATNGLAIASLVLSLMGCTAFIGAIVGHVALSQIRRTGQPGRGFALAGVIIGWSWTLLVVGVITAWGSAVRYGY